MGALKDEDDIENDELEFDVKNDWRKDADATQTNLFKEDDMECGEDELDTGTLILDLNKDIQKEEKKERAKAEARKRKESRRGSKKDAEQTLKALQEAVEGDGSGQEELEILSEEDKALVNDPIFTNKGNEYPQIHGNYFLLDHLVDGGMAKVCRARYLGEGDEADKMVAIKMVQEKFSQDEAFVQMFIDEIKVSFGLNHPNINTTFDYGKIGKNLFVSMEYIHGKDLMVLINELKKQKKTIPIPMAIFIASKMCEALHYAHNFTNKLTGQKYNIVHRDISPHNAMVSYEGYVKVIDFGIAKADTNEVEEQEGEIKGKINYFAPEYLDGQKINHTYDQFAVGLTLWEMLTGKKTFEAPDQLLTLKKIMECEPDLPSKHNKKVPKGLDLIIMKALSRDPVNRHKDMQAFNKELMKFLYKTYPDFHESDISTLMKTLFKSDYEKDLARFKEFGQYSISDIVQKIQAFKEFQKRQKEKVAAQGKTREIVFDFGFDEESVSARGKGKRSLDALTAGRKKARPDALESNERKKRKQKYEKLLEEDDDFKQQNSLENHKGKLVFLFLLVIGFLQREVIMEILFGSDEAQVQFQQPVRTAKKRNKREKAQKENLSNREFVESLKKKRQESQNSKAPQVTKKPEVKKQAAPPVQKIQPIAQKTQPAPQPKPVEQVVQPAPQPKPIAKAESAKAEVVVEDIQNLSIEDLKNKMKKNMAKLQEQSSQQNTLPTTTRKPAQRDEVVVEDIQNLSIEDLKKKMESNLSRLKEKPVSPAVVKSKPINGPPSEPVQEQARVPQEKAEVAVEDIQNLSIEDLKKKMESNLARLKQKSVPSSPINPVEIKPVQVQPPVPQEKAEVVVEDVQNLSIDELRAKMKAQLANLKGKQNPGAATIGSNSEGDSTEDISEGISEEMGEEVVGEMEAEAEAPQEIVESSPSPKVIEEVKPAPVTPSTEVVTEVPSSQPPTPQEVGRELSDTEKELAALKAKMDKMLKDQQEPEEPKLEGKINLSLSDDEVAAQKAEQERIKRELASKFKQEKQEPQAKQIPTGESQQNNSTMGEVMNFIKTRKAFSWMFDD